MAQQYATVLDNPSTPLPLTDPYARYMRNRIDNYDQEIAKFDATEASLLADLAACRAVRARMRDTRDQYRRDLGSHHEAPVVDQPVWPIQAEERGHTAERCPKCGQPMYLTTNYGFVHEVDHEGEGPMWVAAGEWCVQPVPDVTQLFPPVVEEPAP